VLIFDSLVWLGHSLPLDQQIHFKNDDFKSILYIFLGTIIKFVCTYPDHFCKKFTKKNYFYPKKHKNGFLVIFDDKMLLQGLIKCLDQQIGYFVKNEYADDKFQRFSHYLGLYSSLSDKNCGNGEYLII
jgi:hypothetical protein